MTKTEMIAKKMEELKARNWGEGVVVSMTIKEMAERLVNNELTEQAEVKEKETKGIITMKYSEYKNNYAGYKTVPNSYDKKAKTIQVITKSNVCPICRGYCYGDCQS